MKITPDLLRRATWCTTESAQAYADALDDACSAYGIDSPVRLAHFLAQIGHESLDFKYSEEVWGPTPAQERYEGRRDLGNTEPGDGYRFRGHGLIQITGRANHAAARDGLRKRWPGAPDFEVAPQYLAAPLWAARSAAEFWGRHDLNEVADTGDTESITRRINGGLNGFNDRKQRLAKAFGVLTTSYPAPTPPIAQPAPAQAPPATVPATIEKKEPAMLPALLIGLASSLIESFVPLAKDKATDFISKHTGKPELVENVVGAMIDTAVAATGLSDPIAAVVAAKASPEVMTQVQAATLESIDKLAPIIDKLAALDREQWADEEASRQAAAERALRDPNDQDVFLTRSIVALIVGLLTLSAGLVAVLTYFDKDANVVIGLFVTLAGGIAGKFATRYDHRYGSSRSSSAKDAIISELGRRP